MIFYTKKAHSDALYLLFILILIMMLSNGRLNAVGLIEQEVLRFGLVEQT
jgi:hypothetical protein